jgi:hypothetical protein
MKQKARGLAVALALAWDGSLLSFRQLPPQAQAFLNAGAGKCPSARKMARLFRDDAVRELRICWVPRLGGKTGTLADPFLTQSGHRLAFRAIETKHLDGDCHGVVYRRSKQVRG